MTLYDERHATHDVSPVEFDADAPGITVDDDGEAEFDWDEVETVTIDDPPHADAFGTKRFHKLPATVARPIHQPYEFGDERVWLQKPREELKKAAWSLDNAPWTLGHPDTTMVKRVDDIRGFWRNPRYIDGTDDLDADLHIPANDEEAKSYVEESEDVSVGFYNEIARTDEYDGVVGGSDTDGDKLDGYQTNLLFDHVASVRRGRCPPEKGCGLGDAHSGQSFISMTNITEGNGTDGRDSPSTTDSMQATTDAPAGIYVSDDGNWFAVAPDDHTKESTSHEDNAMYPVGSCSSVEDAWNLRNHAEDLTIEQSTLNNRIQRAGEAQDCSGMPWMDESTDSCDCGDNDDNETMEFDIDTEDLAPEAIISQMADNHSGVEKRLSDLREAADAAKKAADALDLDCACDVADEAERLAERVDELEAKVDEYEKEQMREHAEVIAERTDDESRFGNSVDDVLDNHETLDDIEETREIVEELTTEKETTDSGINGGNGDEKRRSDNIGGYRVSPWD